MGLIIGKLLLGIVKIVILPALILTGGALTDLIFLRSSIYIGIGTIVGVVLAGLALILLQQIFSSSLRDATTVDCLSK
jgi:hypothetical protein